MRELETDSLIVLYPQGKRAQALRFARRAEYCREELMARALIEGGASDEKAVLVLPDVSFNNAFVVPPIGREPIGVIPTHQTSDFFLMLNLPPDAGIIGCHEMTHYVQVQQIGGFPGALHAVFGDLYTPQIGLDPWFFEGLAVYYETRLQGGSGRLGSRYFEGFLAAGLQQEGSVDGGLLSEFSRRVSFGHYLFGAFFVDYLARSYGERRLWQVVRKQGRQVVPVFDVSGIFKSVYGKSLSELLDDFARDLKRRLPARKRPPGQRLVHQLGAAVRWARGPAGGEVFVTVDVDQPLTLRVVRAGSTVVSRQLTDVLPGRALSTPNVNLISGLSFSADERHVYFTAVDRGATRQVSRLMRFDLAADTLSQVRADLGGPGGSVSPDGLWYFHSIAVGDAYVLARTSLRTARRVRLTSPAPRHYLVNPVVSPAGDRLLVTEASDAGIRLAIYSAEGERLSDVPAPQGQVFEGRWVDEHRVVYVATDHGVAQAHIADLASGRYRAITQAPYLASQPWSDGKVVRFLNRDGWRFNLEQAEVASPPALPVLAARARRAWTPSPVRVPRGKVKPGAAARVVRHRQPSEDLSVSASSAFRERQPARDRPVHVESDRAYSALDSLFLPNSWGPWFVSSAGNTQYGVALRGGDRLGYHEYALAGAYNLDAGAPSGLLSYINASLAPVFIHLDLQHYASFDEGDDGATDDVRTRETVGLLSARGSWYGSFGSELGFRFSDVLREIGPDRETLEARQFAGPFAGLSWSAFEATAYGGALRGLFLDGLVTFFPRDLARFADFDVEDASAGLATVFPLPLSPRHTLALSARGRALVGVPEDLDLLQIGGGARDLIRDVLQTPGGGGRSAGVLPPGIRFYEPLRGFEDLALYGESVVIGEATYRYPLIIDEGNIATFRFLPRLFARQIDLELFGTGALVSERDEPAFSVGAALAFRLAFWRLPWFVRTQLARRLTYDRAWAPYTELGIDL